MGLIRICALCCYMWLMVQEAKTANILGLFAHPGESHFSVMSTVMSELARRGHNVTVYSSHRLNEKIERLREIIIEPEFPFWQTVQDMAGMNSLQELSQVSEVSMHKYLAATGLAATDYFLTNPQVQELLQLSTADFNYDLIVVDLFHTEALLAFGHAHNKPTIGLVSNNYENYMQNVLDGFVPVACSPISFEAHHEPQAISVNSYWSRVRQIRECIQRRKDFRKYQETSLNQLISKHFHQLYAEPLPTLGTLHAHLAVMLLNNHVPLMRPRPLLLNTISAGGLHIRPARDLPWHIKRFLDEARPGAIYINLGNEQLCAKIPITLLQILFEVFGSLKESVLWTCHDIQKLEGQPKNIMIQHAVAQSDILAHPHVKVFITNGDLLALQEAIVRHVPILGIPLFRHEVSNMQTMVELGVAVTLEYANVSATSLRWALTSVQHNHDIPQIIRQVSREYRDRPLGALETTIYWLDYVMRHNNGGNVLKTRGIGLTTSSQLHLYDLFVFYFGIAIAMTSIAIAIFFGAYIFWKQKDIHTLIGKQN